MENKIVNLIKLYDCLQNYGFICVSIAKQDYEISSKTVYRYIKCLKQAGVIFDYNKDVNIGT